MSTRDLSPPSRVMPKFKPDHSRGSSLSSIQTHSRAASTVSSGYASGHSRAPSNASGHSRAPSTASSGYASEVPRSSHSRTPSETPGTGMMSKFLSDPTPTPATQTLAPLTEIGTQVQEIERPKMDRRLLIHEEYEQPSMLTCIAVYLCYAVLAVYGYFREFMRSYRLEKNKNAQELYKQRNFVPLYRDFESMYTRNIYRRIRDCWNRPICSVPGAITELKDRVSDDYCWNFELPGSTTKVLNMGSYNYLGFAETDGPCSLAATTSIDDYGIGLCSERQSYGNMHIHKELEQLVAEYIGVEDAICFPMGFGTNSMNLPALIGKNSLILSDELNHASLCIGCKISGAIIRTFKHNDMKDLERKLCHGIIHGHPMTRRPYKKILIIVEGVYSMEGTIVHLPDVIALKKKYKTYLFLDEAHSIGCVGVSGRGVAEYWGCDPKDIDILMGTFTKSFAGAGGYIAGSKKMIDFLRVNSHACYSSAMSPPVVLQIVRSMQIIMGKDGTGEGQRRIQQLLRNTHYFRRKLKELGFLLYGNDDSPVVPLLLYFPTKIAEFTRQLLNRSIGAVVVGFPATPLTACRARFCMSAQHTKEHLDYAIQAISEVGDITWSKYAKNRRRSLYEIVGNVPNLPSSG